jgi:hypothetical protein
MIYSLLPQTYQTTIRREKILRAVCVALGMTIAALVMLIVLLLPSYFFLVFSRDDVLRRLDAEQTTFARRDVKPLEAEIETANQTVATYLQGRSKHKNFAPLLVALSEITAPTVHLGQITIRQGSGKYVMELSGRAGTRDDFLEYLRQLRAHQMFDSVSSPVSNLLKEKDVAFTLVADIKRDVFFYDKQ